MSRFGSTDVGGHSTQVYDEMLRVPLVIKLPKGAGPEGLRVASLTSTMDIVPTIVELLELEPPSLPMDGVSLVSAIF